MRCNENLLAVCRANSLQFVPAEYDLARPSSRATDSYRYTANARCICYWHTQSLRRCLPFQLLLPRRHSGDVPLVRLAIDLMKFNLAARVDSGEDLARDRNE
jgi:hypothetical protein